MEKLYFLSRVIKTCNWEKQCAEGYQYSLIETWSNFNDILYDTFVFNIYAGKPILKNEARTHTHTHTRFFKTVTDD